MRTVVGTICAGVLALAVGTLVLWHLATVVRDALDTTNRRSKRIDAAQLLGVYTFLLLMVGAVWGLS